MKDNLRNIREAKFVPAHQLKQHLYPRICINDPGPDGEITFRLIMGLPCCGVDVDIECPPTFTIAELGEVLRGCVELRERIAALPSFSTCAVPKIQAA